MRLSIYAKLVGDQNKPAAHKKLMLEQFNQARANWIALLKLTTDAQGIAKIQNRNTPSFRAIAPLRLVLDGGQQGKKHVLAQNGILHYTPNQGGHLHVDFGAIDMLEDEAFARTSSHAPFTNKDGYMVAGNPLAADSIASAVMFRRVSRGTSARVITSPIITANTTSTTTATTATPNPALEEAISRISATANEKMVATTIEHNAVVMDLNNKIQIKDNRVRALETQISDQDSIIKIKDQELAASRKATEQARAEVKTLKAHTEKEIAVTDIYSNLGAQIHGARSKLASDKVPMSLGRVSVKMKAVLGKDGNSLVLPDTDTLQKVDAAGLADVDIEYVPQASDTFDRSFDLPDFTSLTERACSRMAVPLGLKPEISYAQLPEGSAAAAGQCIKQSPKAGAKVQKGQRLLLVIAQKHHPEEQ